MNETAVTTIETLREIEALLSTLYTEAEALEWWISPHPQFEGKRAVDVVDDGRADELLASLKRVTEGAYL